MNDPAKKLVEALRSGRFKQGQGYLNKNGELCCLGVACELYIEAGGDLPKTLIGSHYNYGTEKYALPEVVREWLGFNSPAGRYATGSLEEDNDNGEPFEGIATKIEREPEGLFA